MKKRTVWALTDEQVDRIIMLAMAIINALIAAACVPVHISISKGNEKNRPLPKFQHDAHYHMRKL